MRLSTWSTAVVAVCWATMATAMTLAEVPACGLQCAVKVVSVSACKSLANTTCLCSNQPVNDALGACILGSCSIREALAMRKFSDVLCDKPLVDNSSTANIITPVFGSLAALCFAVRVLARWQNGLRTSWRLDDWLIVPAVLASLTLVGVSTIIGYSGLGRDMWWLTGDEISFILYWFYWAELLYSFIVGFTKMSVLAFYLQIFPNKKVRCGSYLLLACNAGYIVSHTLATIFQCDPVPGAWLAWDGTFKARCINLPSLVWSGAFLSIVFDVAMLVLPMPALWKLNMSTRKKAHVMIMFSLGLFVTTVSIIRLQYIAVFAKTTNVTQDFLPIGIWSIIEVCVGVICACLPAMRAVLTKLLPKVFGTSSNRTGGKQHYYSGSKYGPGGVGGGGSSSNGKMMSYTEAPHVRVRSEFTVRSRRRDESSFVELDDLSTGLPPGQGAQAGSSKEDGDVRIIIMGDRDGAASAPAQHATFLDSSSERLDSLDIEAGVSEIQPAVVRESPLSAGSRQYLGRADMRHLGRG